jgi:hypothetical protein
VRRGSRLILSRAFGALLGVALGGAIALQSAAAVEAAQIRQQSVADASSFTASLNDRSMPVTVGEVEEQLVIDAVRSACSQRSCKRVEAALLTMPTVAQRASAWRYGAAFARLYVPDRAREIFAPPSTSDPDA